MATYEALSMILFTELQGLVERGEDPETVADAALKAYSLFRISTDAQHERAECEPAALHQLITGGACG